MRIGIISDTHGYFDPAIPTLFAGVDHILHAGDIGPNTILLELEALAPVTAVLGNTDFAVTCNLTEVVQLAGRKILVHHILDVHAPEESLKLRLAREQPDLVVFGHTHKPFSRTLGQTLYLNPGYAGKRRFNLPRSIALLDLSQTELNPQFLSLT